MVLFYFLARNIGYTFAVAFFTVIIGWFSTFFGFFLGSTFLLFPYEKILPVFLKWVPLSVVVSSFFHYVVFGFLTPVKIPALMKSHRRINSVYSNNMKVKDEETWAIYSHFTDLPMYNTVMSFIFTSIVGFIVLGGSYYMYKFSGQLNSTDINIIYKIVTLSMIISIIFYTISTYLLTESLTNNERAALYNNLLNRGYRTPPRALIGVRLKFFFFIVLMIITLLTFAAFMEKIQFYREYNLVLIISYFSIIIFTSISLMVINSNSILKILKDMRRVAKIITSGQRAVINVLSLEKEFAAIEYDLMEMAWEIDEYRRDLEGKVDTRTDELKNALSDLKGKDDIMQKQLDMASIIQKSILPGKIEDWNELKFSVRYRAMDKIGGDFYDIHQLKDEKLGVMIADVSGHGIPAALVTTMAKISFGNSSARYDSPRRIFQEVNQNILDHVKTQDYMTCFMIAIDDDYKVVYANASHQKAILLRTTEGEIELLDTNGLFIGAVEEARDSYEEKQVSLNYGDRLIFYTDGIPEATNSDRQEYSNTRLENTIVQSRHLPLEEFADFIISDVQSFIGGKELEDDLTLLIIELKRDDAVDIIKRSKKLVSTLKYTEAIELLEDALVKYHDNQKIIYNLSKNYFRIGNYTKSIQHVERYLDNDKRNKYAFYIAGASYFQIGEFGNALDNFDKALELDPNFVNSIFASGMSFKKMGEPEQAVKLFERVINIDSDNKMALFELKKLRDEKEPPGDG